jgi:hypothetical protein
MVLRISVKGHMISISPDITSMLKRRALTKSGNTGRNTGRKLRLRKDM